ncbi:MAG: cytochrome c [Pirellulaceae bacterium]|nr:cytochrome c [Pirellulaceae bacterium]
MQAYCDLPVIHPWRRGKQGWIGAKLRVFHMIGTVRSLFGLLLCSVFFSSSWGDSADHGYRLLVDKAYLPADFDQETFDQVWQVWPEPLRSKAYKATVAERRKLAFERYGLSQRPGERAGKPLQYVVSDDGQWSMNCFSCHGGRVNGVVTPGAPNTDFRLATMTAEIRLTKLKASKQLTRMDVGSLFMPLGSNTGTTNAVMFGVALMAYRQPDLSFSGRRLPPPMVHHDMDAPPWWNIYRKEKLYIDGFAPSGPRPLMQFMLVEENGPEKFREWESDFEHVYSYIQSLRAPEYPDRIDQVLAKQGQVAFRRACAECHGSYGEAVDYPERTIPLDEIGTDPVRLRALTSVHRKGYGESWFGHFGTKTVEHDPVGYVAPPLDGIWASSPYLHNGAIPTLWHLLHPEERPVVWRRSAQQLDFSRVGLHVDEFEQVPEIGRSATDRREFFDTRRIGKSASGHEFVNRLSDSEKHAVLEYLKTL